MAWSIKCDKGGDCGAWIEDNGVAHFPKNTGYSITYTITYTDKDGNCGSTTITQPGGCSGGGGDTCEGITITGNVGTPEGTEFVNGGTLDIAGGTLYFTHSTPAPPPVPTGCDGVDWGYHWANNSEIMADETGYCESILRAASKCTMPAKEGTDNGVITSFDDNYVMVKIKNSLTGRYIPYNGEFYLYPESASKTSIQYRDTTVSYDEWSHYAYGATASQPTNLMLNPGQDTGWLKCKISEPQYLNDKLVGDNGVQFRVAYSSLNDKSKDKNGQKVIGNLRVHRDLYYYNGMNITFSKGDNTGDEDPNAGGVLRFKKHMKIYIEVTSDSSGHHSFDQTEYNRGWHLYVDSDGELDQLTPVNLFNFK